MITLTTVGPTPRCFAFTAYFVILTGESTKLPQNIILLCQKGYKEISLATIGCI